MWTSCDKYWPQIKGIIASFYFLSADYVQFSLSTSLDVCLPWHTDPYAYVRVCIEACLYNHLVRERSFEVGTTNVPILWMRKQRHRCFTRAGVEWESWAWVRWLKCVFIQQVFTEHLLCTAHSCRYWEHTKNTVSTVDAFMEPVF